MWPIFVIHLKTQNNTAYFASGGDGWLEFPDIWSGRKPWWNWYLILEVNFGEVRRTQLAKSTILASTLEPLGSFKVCSDAKERVGCWKQREASTYLSLVKLHPWFLSLQWKICLWTELQPWFLRFQWNTCPWAEHSDDDTQILNTLPNISNFKESESSSKVAPW